MSNEGRFDLNDSFTHFIESRTTFFGTWTFSCDIFFTIKVKKKLIKNSLIKKSFERKISHISFAFKGTFFQQLFN